MKIWGGIRGFSSERWENSFCKLYCVARWPQSIQMHCVSQIPPGVDFKSMSSTETQFSWYKHSTMHTSIGPSHLCLINIYCYYLLVLMFWLKKENSLFQKKFKPFVMFSTEENVSHGNTWLSCCFTPGGEGRGIMTGYRKADFNSTYLWFGEASPAKAHVLKVSSPAVVLWRSG